MKKSFQIVYQSDRVNKNEIHPLFKQEANAMREAGIEVGLNPKSYVKEIMYRGCTIFKKEDYPTDERYIHTYQDNLNYLFISNYYPLIEEYTPETFFVNKLDEKLIELIQLRKWSRAFIKNELTALEHIAEFKSVWPDTSLEDMTKLYEQVTHKSEKYAVRKYMGKIKNEERYWIFNGTIYHKSSIIPDVVKKAVEQLNKMGGRYYVVDATPEFIVEVNPGESSDRHAVNSPELFASWIKSEFH